MISILKDTISLESSDGFFNLDKILNFFSVHIESQKLNGHLLKKNLIESLLPFLRCSAYFFHCLTGIKFPESLQTGVLFILKKFPIANF